MPNISEPIIYRYHSINRPPVYFNGGENSRDNLFLGIELEFDTRDARIGQRVNKLDLIFKSNQIWGNPHFIYYMNDGSLYRGLEMITQPATFEYHCDNRDNYERLFNEITAHGFKSQSYRSCGLHIHFNRNFFEENPDLYTINLLYLVERFWRESVLLSRRNYPNLVRWADKYDKNPKEVVEEMKHSYLSHHLRYKAINLLNRDTIEFRLYRGTLDLSDFFATLELTHNLILCAKTKSPIELQNIDFSELVNTSAELRKYYKKCNRKSALNRLPDNLK